MKNTLLEIMDDEAFAEGESWRRRSFVENEVIVREGDQERKMYLIESGTLRVSGRVELEDQRHIQPGLCDLGVGDVFGELALFDTQPRSASVVAVSSGELREIDCRCLSEYLEQHPAQGYALLKAMFKVVTDRLSRANERVEHLFAWGLKAHGIDKHL
jgi:CRP-like cAMP-binding protein